MITINGKEHSVRQMTAGDLAVLAPLAKRLEPALQQDAASFDMGALLIEFPEVLSVAEQLLDGANLRELPLHDAVRVLHELLIEWLKVNGPYMAEEVAPAVTSIATEIKAIAAQLGQAAQ
ncbi:MAG: hypothetical protein OQL08_09170 [Gammaproteobacteria bacterium]|nr:hypothetical protein [Gammaproteobacteria bacterium]